MQNTPINLGILKTRTQRLIYIQSCYINQNWALLTFNLVNTINERVHAQLPQNNKLLEPILSPEQELSLFWNRSK